MSKKKLVNHGFSVSCGNETLILKEKEKRISKNQEGKKQGRSKKDIPRAIFKTMEAMNNFYGNGFNQLIGQPPPISVKYYGRIIIFGVHYAVKLDYQKKLMYLRDIEDRFTEKIRYQETIDKQKRKKYHSENVQLLIKIRDTLISLLERTSIPEPQDIFQYVVNLIEYNSNIKNSGSLDIQHKKIKNLFIYVLTQFPEYKKISSERITLIFDNFFQHSLPKNQSNIQTRGTHGPELKGWFSIGNPGHFDHILFRYFRDEEKLLFVLQGRRNLLKNCN